MSKIRDSGQRPLQKSERNFGAKIKSDFSKYTVVLAINDRALNRNHKPLGSKLTTLAKLELIHCVEFLEKELGVGRVIVYEIKYEDRKQQQLADVC